MADGREAVLRKFARIRHVAKATTRRVDYKGERRRVNLRLATEIASDLDIISFAGGIAKNSFCEAVLREAIGKRLKEVRGEYDAVAWDAVVRCAQSRRR